MLCERLRQFRKDNRLTQQNIADVLKVDRTTYTYYETGATQPSVKTICKLAKIYNVSVGHLVGVEENHPELCREVTSNPTRLRQTSKMDSFPYLEKSEQSLLVHYRLISDEKKSEVLNFMKELMDEDVFDLDDDV